MLPSTVSMHVEFNSSFFIRRHVIWPRFEAGVATKSPPPRRVSRPLRVNAHSRLSACPQCKVTTKPVFSTRQLRAEDTNTRPLCLYRKSQFGNCNVFLPSMHCCKLFRIISSLFVCDVVNPEFNNCVLFIHFKTCL